MFVPATGWTSPRGVSTGDAVAGTWKKTKGTLCGANRFQPDGKMLAAGCGDAFVLHDVKTGKLNTKIKIDKSLSLIGYLAFSPNGHTLAVGGFPQRGGDSCILVYAWDAKAQGFEANAQRSFAGQKAFTYSVTFSPNGKLLASANQDQTAKLWNLKTGKTVKTISAHSDFVCDVAFSPKGDEIVSLGRDALMMWWMDKLLKGNGQ